MLIRSRMWMYDYFSAAINITQIRLYTMYFDSTGVATTLLANYTAAVSDTRQKPWRSRSCLSISCFFFCDQSHWYRKLHVSDKRRHSTHVGAVVQLVEYRTRNQEVAGSTHTRSTASNLQQVANLLCAQANSDSYPQRDGKWVVATARE